MASLNHSNIAAICGIEESGDVRALVMELVEGEDLSRRIARGAISLDETLPIAVTDTLSAVISKEPAWKTLPQTSRRPSGVQTGFTFAPEPDVSRVSAGRR